MQVLMITELAAHEVGDVGARNLQVQASYPAAGKTVPVVAG